jgi:mRNA interferase YafQ
MREIQTSDKFLKNLKKFCNLHPDLKNKIEKTIEILSLDVDAPELHSHKLRGKLNKFYSARIDYKYRIIFEFDETNLYLFIPTRSWLS